MYQGVIQAGAGEEAICECGYDVRCRGKSVRLIGGPG